MLLYALLSASGLLFLKIGAQNSFSFSFGESIKFEINWYLVIGLVLYIAAFITSIIAMKKTNLNYFYPISAGLVYVIVCAGSYFVLHEKFTIIQIISVSCIMVGVVLMNIKL